MAERSYTAKLNGKEITATSSLVAVFRDAYIGGAELANRMSELMWFQIYVLDAAFGVSPHDILRSVKDVEDGEPASGVKPATQFRKMPLKGLWHKHYFSAHFAVTNIRQALKNTGVEKLVSEVMNPAKPDVITREMITELSHLIIHDPLEAGDAAGRLTGEWIVYLRRGATNYYLCCNTHSAGDQSIYDEIAEHCVRDFPDLMMWLKEVQNEAV
jgi:hypothetical protein